MDASSNELHLQRLQIQCRGYAERHESLIKNMERCAVVLCILMSASYKGTLQPPKPLDTSALISLTSLWQKLFFYFNNFSFFASACGLILCASCTFFPSMPSFSGSTTPIEKEIADRLHILALTLPRMIYVTLFLLLSVVLGVVANAFAGLSMVHEIRSEQMALIIPSVIGGFIFVETLLISLKDMFRYLQEIHDLQSQLWESLKHDTLFGLSLTWCMERSLFKLGFRDKENPVRAKSFGSRSSRNIRVAPTTEDYTV